MKPGRELDALVAEKVMGLLIGPRSSFTDGGDLRESIIGDFYYSTGLLHILKVPAYSTDIATAWEVVGKLTAGSRFWFSVNRYPKLGLNPDGPPYEQHYRTNFGAYEGSADTAPHAICLAALKTVGYK